MDIQKMKKLERQNLDILEITHKPLRKRMKVSRLKELTIHRLLQIRLQATFQLKFDTIVMLIMFRIKQEMVEATFLHKEYFMEQTSMSL